MPMTDLSRSAALGFQMGQGAGGGNQLGESIRGLLNVWMQRKMQDEKFERESAMQNLNYMREKEMADREFDIKTGEMRMAFGQDLQNKLERMRGLSREEVMKELETDLPLMRMKWGWVFGDDFDTEVRDVVDAYFPAGGSQRGAKLNPLGLKGAQRVGYAGAKAAMGVLDVIKPTRLMSGLVNTQLGGLSALTGKQYPEITPEDVTQLDPRYAGLSKIMKLIRRK